MTTYENYCKIRDSKGFKDSNVAFMACIGKSTFSDWKAGRSQPKADKLKKIAEVLDVSIESFYDSENYEMDKKTHTWEYKIPKKDMDLIMEVMSDKDCSERLLAYAEKLLELKKLEEI